MTEVTPPNKEYSEQTAIKQQKREKYWDIAGICVGLMGCLAQLTQVISEWQNTGPSNLSLVFVLGYWLVFAFWLAYGLFFKRMAIIVTNSLAFLLQTALLLAQW
jgi:uncharacterized protein with PQ loop repeat